MNTSKRLRYDKLHMACARAAAAMSSAVRNKVGCVITMDERSISNGWNGRLPGDDNCCEYSVDGGLVTRDDVIHAEENAILYAAKEGIALNGGSLYITVAPCIKCARMIIACGITRVVYANIYRSNEGLVLLRKKGVKVDHME